MKESFLGNNSVERRNWKYEHVSCKGGIICLVQPWAKLKRLCLEINPVFYKKEITVEEVHANTRPDKSHTNEQLRHLKISEMTDSLGILRFLRRRVEAGATSQESIDLGDRSRQMQYRTPKPSRLSDFLSRQSNTYQFDDFESRKKRFKRIDWWVWLLRCGFCLLGWFWWRSR